MKYRLILLCVFLTLVLSAGVAMAGDNIFEGHVMVAKLDLDDEIWDDTGKRVTANSTSATDHASRTPDPIEGWNRFWFDVNDKIYTGVFKPIGKGYDFVVPSRVRGWIGNFFHNLLYPVRFVNSVLQGKFDTAGLETSKFIFNTTIGLGGLADVTSDRKVLWDIPTGEEDTGQTLGAWGIGNGVYVVWPIIGPSSARDTVGLVGDYFLTPWNYLNPWYYSVGSTAFQRVNVMTETVATYEGIKGAALDPYEAVRDAYLRMRAKNIKQ